MKSYKQFINENLSDDKVSVFKFESYTLILSHNPCDIFTYYNVEEMHGLNLEDCKNYNNTPQDAYIAGLCNFVPKPDNNYKNGDPKFLFINLSRCTDDIKTFGLIMHELMHQSFDVHNDDISKEEEIITWAELEAYKIFEIVKRKKL